MSDEIIRYVLLEEQKFYKAVLEASNLTRDIAESAQRQDTVSLDLLFALRQKSILLMQEVRANLQLLETQLAPEDALRLRQLRQGGKAKEKNEEALVARIASNQTLFQSLLRQDEAVNRKLGREKSIYASK